jgi:hypothetical protein
MGFLIFLGFVAVAVPIAVLAHRADKQRTEALRTLATSLGLQFAPTDDNGVQAGFGGFNLFQNGRHRTVRNIAYGPLDDAEVMLFDYAYTTGGGKHRTTHHQTVAFFQSDALDLPEFVARPEGLFDKIGQVFGYQDIDLPLHPDFSRRYILRGADEGRVRDFFRPDVARFFEANPGLSVEAKSDRFILYRPGRRLSPEQWREWLAKGRETFDVLVSSQ